MINVQVYGGGELLAVEFAFFEATQEQKCRVVGEETFHGVGAEDRLIGLAAAELFFFADGGMAVASMLISQPHRERMLRKLRP